MKESFFDNIFIKLFVTFLKIGAVTFGGGYAMLPIIKRDIVEKKSWLNEEEFLDAIAVAQSVPGAVAINTAIYTGYKINGTRGAFVSLVGTVIPSFTIILAIAMLFVQWQDLAVVQKAFTGIRSAVVGLIFAAVISLGKSMLYEKKTWMYFGLALIIALLGTHPFAIIIIFGTAAVFLNKLKNTKDNEKGRE